MPNWVDNRVYMRNIGNNKKLYDKKGNFDFNNIIPMPESLNITDGSETDTAIRLVLHIAQQRFDQYGPVMNRRDMVTDKEIISRDSDLVEDIEKYMKWKHVDFETAISNLIKVGLQYVSNICMYHAPTWYDWSIANWSTKWNASSTTIIDNDCVNFHTPWSIPYNVFIALSQIYPYDEITVDWIEESGLCGVASFHGGEQIQDDTYIIDWSSELDENGKYIGSNRLFMTVKPY